MPDARDIILRPIITEKTTGMVERGVYTFQVALKATKTQVKHAVEELFDVKVKQVSTARCKGKMKRLGVHQGPRPDWKKAIVTLAEGDTIEVIEGL